MAGLGKIHSDGPMAQYCGQAEPARARRIAWPPPRLHDLACRSPARISEVTEITYFTRHERRSGSLVSPVNLPEILVAIHH